MERHNSLRQDSRLEFLAIEAFKTSGFLIVNKTLINKLGLLPAILLSNYIDKHIYFKEKFPELDGWFYLTHEQQKEQLNISEHSIIKNKQFLIDKKIIESQKKGIPSKEYLHINFKILIEALTNTTLDPPKTGGLDPVISEGLYKDNKLKDIIMSDSEQSDEATHKKITPSMFEEMWKLYPRKVDKGAAKTVWLKICNKPLKDRPTWRQIKSSIRRQSMSDRWQDPKFIPHPRTWLNQSRWLDDADEMKIIKYDKEEERYTCPNGWAFGKSFNGSKQGCMECEDYTPKIYNHCRLLHEQKYKK